MYRYFKINYPPVPKETACPIFDNVIFRKVCKYFIDQSLNG